MLSYLITATITPVPHDYGTSFITVINGYSIFFADYVVLVMWKHCILQNAPQNTTECTLLKGLSSW